MECGILCLSFPHCWRLGREARLGYCLLIILDLRQPSPLPPPPPASAPPSPAPAPVHACALVLLAATAVTAAAAAVSVCRSVCVCLCLCVCVSNPHRHCCCWFHSSAAVASRPCLAILLLALLRSSGARPRHNSLVDPLFISGHTTVCVGTLCLLYVLFGFRFPILSKAFLSSFRCILVNHCNHPVSFNVSSGASKLLSTLCPSLRLFITLHLNFNFSGAKRQHFLV